MKQTQIKDMQTKVGAEPDGFWGRVSQAALEKHLKRLMPNPHPFPLPDEKSLTAFYGPHGVEDGYTPPTKKITLPFPLWLYGNPKNLVRTLSPHEKCADSLLRVFVDLARVYPTTAERKAAGILCYDGLYNPRLMRGSSSKWSMHAWAIAIDLDAWANGNSTHWPAKAVMPLEVMECFAMQGWLGLGWAASRDAMHFQATK